ncbi:MAG: Bax inhibitor-1/YccA family protein [Elusimicrobiota bacterium]
MNQYLNAEQIAAEQRSFLMKVYWWMATGLCVTGIIAMYVVSRQDIVFAIASNTILFLGLVIGELALVGYLAFAVKSMRANTAGLVFLAYAALNGLTFGVVLYAFTRESVASTFFMTAGTFALVSLWGYFTKSDLSSVGHFSMMALFGIIIASVINIFLRSSGLYWIISYAGVGIFIGLTAYDTQKIKAMNIIGNEGTEEDKKEAIMGALTLYLDFINLFLMLLRIMGRRRD